MNCPRHGEVDLLSSAHDSMNIPGGHRHFLSCGCAGTAEQLRDPDYNPNPPSAESVRMAELEAEVASLRAQLAGERQEPPAPDEPPSEEPAAAPPDEEPPVE